MKNRANIPFVLLTLLFLSCSFNLQNEVEIDNKLRVGAERTQKYFPFLANKKVAVVANQTSNVGELHLVDTLIHAGINVVKVFGPEHGFRGNRGAGEIITDNVDVRTRVPVISLYGANKKPTPDQLKGVEVVLFDIQDVGVRFYTYISTMSLVMEACAENGIPMIILDRPNPHGHYVDGPVRQACCSSFVGMHTVPVVHGMTIGEYAQMVNGEGWLKKGIHCELTVIPVDHYDHQTPYILPVPPSPNLPNQRAVELYPSLCLFEGTKVSVGRGTDFPFQCFGHPDFEESYAFYFTPQSNPISAPNPKNQGLKCYGMDLRKTNDEKVNKLDLTYLIEAYTISREKESFFNDYFKKLAGNLLLEEQIRDGLKTDEIYQSWQKDLSIFKLIRKEYLLYPDFE